MKHTTMIDGRGRELMDVLTSMFQVEAYSKAGIKDGDVVLFDEKKRTDVEVGWLGDTYGVKIDREKLPNKPLYVSRGEAILFDDVYVAIEKLPFDGDKSKPTIEVQIIGGFYYMWGDNWSEWFEKGLVLDASDYVVVFGVDKIDIGRGVFMLKGNGTYNIVKKDEIKEGYFKVEEIREWLWERGWNEEIEAIYVKRNQNNEFVGCGRYISNTVKEYMFRTTKGMHYSVKTSGLVYKLYEMGVIELEGLTFENIYERRSDKEFAEHHPKWRAIGSRLKVNSPLLDYVQKHVKKIIIPTMAMEFDVEDLSRWQLRILLNELQKIEYNNKRRSVRYMRNAVILLDKEIMLLDGDDEIKIDENTGRFKPSGEPYEGILSDRKYKLRRKYRNGGIYSSVIEYVDD